MRPSYIVCCIAILSAPSAALAQTGSSPPLTAKQQLGRRLFGQDCGICHTPPTMTSKPFGPVLLQSMVKGNEAAITKFISDGSDQMPGFKYFYKPAEIEAIVAYLDTIRPSPKSQSKTGGGK